MIVMTQGYSFQDLDTSSDEEDFQSNRKQFQQARSVSTASKKSISFFDMEMSNKDENLRQSVPFVRQITEDGKAKLEIYRPTTNPIYIYTQVSCWWRCGCLDDFYFLPTVLGIELVTFRFQISTKTSLEIQILLKNFVNSCTDNDTY